MRLTFPQGEHADVELAPGETRIGGGAGNQVRLSVPGLPPRQAVIVRGPRLLWLRIADGAPAAHVNGRAVRAMAWLRPGDVLSFDSVQAVLLGDESPVPRPLPDGAPAALQESARVAASRIVLRGVAGAHFGRSFSLQMPLLIGRSPLADVRIDDPSFADRHAQLELHGERVVLRQLGRQDASLLNGRPVRDAVVAPGDQLVFEQHRFVLEAPGLGPRILPTRVAGDDAASAPSPPPRPRGRRSMTVLWLILAAVAVAAALTLLLIYAPRFEG